MSKSNLIDVLAGLRKYHSSPYLSAVEQELAKRREGELEEGPEYVVHQHNETVKFEYGDNVSSNNPLVKVAKGGLGAWRFYLEAGLLRLLHGGRYVLHSE